MSAVLPISPPSGSRSAATRRFSRLRPLGSTDWPSASSRGRSAVRYIQRIGTRLNTVIAARPRWPPRVPGRKDRRTVEGAVGSGVMGAPAVHQPHPAPGEQPEAEEEQHAGGGGEADVERAERGVVEEVVEVGGRVAGAALG